MQGQLFPGGVANILSKRQTGDDHAEALCARRLVHELPVPAGAGRRRDPARSQDHRAGGQRAANRRPRRRLLLGHAGCLSACEGGAAGDAGYAGGQAGTAQYETVSTGTTGHAESVRIVYDPAQVSFGQLLKVYFSVAHDPTELDHQGPDSGPQYRSEIFTTDAGQAAAAKQYIAQLDGAKIYGNPIVTKIEPLPAFYPAEGYHQDYAEQHPYNPYIVINDTPKIHELKSQFPALYTEQATKS